MRMAGLVAEGPFGNVDCPCWSVCMSVLCWGIDL